MPMQPRPTADVVRVPRFLVSMGASVRRGGGARHVAFNQGSRVPVSPSRIGDNGRMDRDALAEFLRLRRESMTPAEVGLSDGVRHRRTAGLRREEVAQLAAMSVDYYCRLEQSRSAQPSTQMVRSLARALRLTDDETAHLHRLAGHAAPDPRRTFAPRAARAAVRPRPDARRGGLRLLGHLRHPRAERCGQAADG
ncbi:MAG: helix-turn-helix transcriptional regulator [Mycobacterium sp.]